MASAHPYHVQLDACVGMGHRSRLWFVSIPSLGVGRVLFLSLYYHDLIPCLMLTLEIISNPKGGSVGLEFDWLNEI